MVDLFGIADRSFPVISPPIASKHIVALSSVARAANFSKKSASVWMRTYSAPSDFNKSAYSYLLTTFMTFTPFS